MSEIIPIGILVTSQNMKNIQIYLKVNCIYSKLKNLSLAVFNRGSTHCSKGMILLAYKFISVDFNKIITSQIIMQKNNNSIPRNCIGHLLATANLSLVSLLSNQIWEEARERARCSTPRNPPCFCPT